MTQSKDFRIINKLEKSIISNALSKISKDFDLVMKKIQDKLYIAFDTTFTKSFNPSIYLSPSEHFNLIEKFDSAKQITSAGLYFGFIKKEYFRLSLEGGEYLAKNEEFFKEQILVINSNGEKSILYGNDINKEDVLNLKTLRERLL